MENNYQNKMWALQEQIYECPLLKKGKDTCYDGLFDIKFGPDAVYVGEYYGSIKNHPKILFIGKNPGSEPTDFGIKMNTEKFKAQNPSFKPTDFYDAFYAGWNDLAGVSGFDYVKQNRGFKDIMEQLFTNFKDTYDLLKTIAITNGVLCTGSGEIKTPVGNMWKNCMSQQAWLKKTLKILEPDIIFIFSGETWDNFKAEKIGYTKKEDFTPEIRFAYKIVWLDGKKSLVLRIPHFSRTVKTTEAFENLFEKYEKSDSTLIMSEYVLKEILGLAKNQLGKMGFKT